MSKRVTERINYKLLSETGQKQIIQKEGVSVTVMEDQKDLVSSLKVKFDSTVDDINDFTDEYDLKGCSCTIQDIDDVITKIENLRSKFRTLNIQIKSLDFKVADNHQEIYNQSIDKIKEFIKGTKQIRDRLRSSEEQTKMAEKEISKRSVDFLVDNIKKLFADVQVEIDVEVSKVSDDQITRRNNEIPKLRKRIDVISQNLKELILQPINDGTYKYLKERYDELLTTFSVYESYLKNEAESRDLEKQKLFKESHLNIKLDKFKGYESALDIYSFEDAIFQFILE